MNIIMFMFSGFWIWLGSLIMISVILTGIAEIIKSLGDIIRIKTFNKNLEKIQNTLDTLGRTPKYGKTKETGISD